MRRRRQHRAVFVAAGLYNLVWGLWAATSPDALYQTLGVPVPTHPEVAACLGMVIGLYGVVYLDIARAPERGWIPAAVGLTGKLAGPAALVWHIMTGNWPTTALPVVVFNDIVWWLPFAWYLRDAWPNWRADLRGSGAG
jgi:hypothetical protein